VTISVVQEGALVNVDNAATIADSTASNVTSGNLVVFAVFGFSTVAPAFVSGDVTQTAGTATVTDIRLDRTQEWEESTNNWLSVAIFSAVVTGSGTLTLSCALPTGSYYSSTLCEYSTSGSWPTSAARVADTDGQNQTTATTAWTTPDVTSSGEALFVGGVCSNSSTNPTTYTPDAAWTEIIEETEGGADQPGTVIRSIVTSGTTDAASGTCSQTVQHTSAVVVYAPATVTTDQEGFRFGLDDGSESAHTWSQNQDTNETTALSITRLLRLLVNATGDPASVAYTLRYQKNGAGGYTAVPVGSSTTSYTSPPAAPTGTGTTVGTAATTWNITRPSASSGDLVVFVVAWDDSTTTDTVTPPAGPNGEAAVSIAGPVASASTEMRMQAWYYVATGAWSGGTSGWTASASETCRAVTFVIPSGQYNASDPIGWSNTRASAGTAETSVNSPTGTTESNDLNGRMYIGFGSDVDALTAPGSDWNTINNATGGGVGLCVGSRNTLASNSESITALTATIAGDSWASLAFVVKPYSTTVTNQVYISTSANIAAGGEATTARLSAPSGKSTSDFFTGRRWDDENGSDSTDITTDDYSEFEWCLTVQSPAANGDYFDFRVYSGANQLSTYGVTPRWTISTSAATTVSAGAGAVTFTGQAPTIISRALTLPGTATVTFAGQAATAISIALALPGQAAVTFTGQAATVISTALALPGQAQPVIAGQAPTVTAVGGDTVTASPGAAAVTIAGQAATIIAKLLALPGNASPAIAGQAPTVLSRTLALPGAASVVAQGQAATVISTALALPQQAQLAIAGQAPTVTATSAGVSTALPGAATVTFAGQAPVTISRAAAAPGAGTVTVQGQAARAAALVAAGAAPVVVQGQAPSLSIFYTATITPGAAALIVEGQAVIVTAVSGWQAVPAAGGSWADAAASTGVWSDVASSGGSWA
jgi:hypothetical protein